VSDRKKRISVEVIGRFDIPYRTPMQRLLLDKTLTLPLKVVATSPTERSETVEADFLTFQNRITEGDFYLPPLPYKRDLHPIVDTRSRVVSEVLLDYRVGRGIPGDLDQHNALVARIIAALDVHDARAQA